MSYKGIKLLSLLLLSLLVGCHSGSKQIHIAVVGPFEKDKETLQATSIRRGVMMALEDLEASESIPKDKFTFDFISDHADPDLAQKIAHNIGVEDYYVAVIGHFFSGQSLAAAPEYAKYKVPAITLGATNDRITEHNPWYFRTIFNDQLQGQYLANYVCDILDAREVIIIYENDPYGNGLKDVFSETVIDLEHDVFPIEVSQKDPTNMDKVIDDIVAHQFNNETNVENPIFIAAHNALGAALIKEIRDRKITNPIIGPDSFASKQFSQGFANYPKEKEDPGYYTRNIIVSSPFILDIAGSEAQKFNMNYEEKYKQDADWTAVLGYDTAQILLQGINNLSQKEVPESTSLYRYELRKYLANINTPNKSISGLIGNIYFDSEGNSQRPVTIGTYKGSNSVISALKQYSEIENISNLEVNSGNIITINGVQMYRTDIVYVGAQVNSINNLNMDSQSADLDFYIWFRSQREINIKDIEFLNSTSPIILPEKPLVNKKNGLIEYQLYHIKGNFRLNFSAKTPEFHKHILGISIKHKNLPRNVLILVPDMLGGSATTNTIDSNQEKLMLSPEYRLRIAGYDTYQHDYNEPTYGDPDYMSPPTMSIGFSSFNYEVYLKQIELLESIQIPKEIRKQLLIISISVMFLSYIFAQFRGLRTYHRTFWVLQFFSTIIALYCGRTPLLNIFIKYVGVETTDILDKIYSAFFVLMPAHFLIMFFNYFIWTPVEIKKGKRIPDLLKKIIAFVIYLIATFIIFKFILNKSINSLLATSGIIAITAGYAVRENLSNILSGIVVGSEKNFHIGDYVRIGSKYEGQVVDMNWRTVSMQNESNDIVSIPNNKVADMDIINLSSIDKPKSVTITIQIHSQYAPQRVIKILRDAVLSTNCILFTPTPDISFNNVLGASCEYNICFYIKNYVEKNTAKDKVWQRIWIHLYFAGIGPAWDNQVMDASVIYIKDRPSLIINHIPYFKALTQKEKEMLSSEVRLESYLSGQVIVTQGEIKRDLYLIGEGVVSITHRTDEDLDITLARYGVSDIFGESSLMTGKERTANVIALTNTVVFKVEENTLVNILNQNKNFYDSLNNLQHTHHQNTGLQVDKAKQERIIRDRTFLDIVKLKFRYLFPKK
ncbi:ABC transporter substrate-binding protein [Spirochaeta cellobiosiphila]|uniref:ABC transporter substrate-binding protein n=1 Tax=Spirochaeta cellobiosiphila TaxID=504483 RepID=UPI00040202E3|nr:ABC transporter substrate-binding protein [Spirochaeta cellobiosiphila]